MSLMSVHNLLLRDSSDNIFIFENVLNKLSLDCKSLKKNTFHPLSPMSSLEELFRCNKRVPNTEDGNQIDHIKLLMNSTKSLLRPWKLYLFFLLYDFTNMTLFHLKMVRFYSRKHIHNHFAKYYDFLRYTQAKEHPFSISIQGSLA